MMQRLLIAFVKSYRLLLSPWLGSACRFTPTCSAYSLQALQQHGAGAGTYMTVARLARCHPWCDGGLDPVPATKPRLFTRWVAPPPEKNNPRPTSAAPSSG
jgi:putative membrane protein insertion efficiency factor